jgi:mannose-6-phosphate isomerase-like protein (cupin superfamily)
MATPYTHKKLTEVEDSAPGLGISEFQESRFANDDLEAEQTGFTHHRFRPGKRQGFGHAHRQAEEVYVVLAGSGRMKLDDEVIEVEALHAIRVAPGVMHAWEAGSDGMEVLAFGPRVEGDAEFVQGWWTD